MKYDELFVLHKHFNRLLLCTINIHYVIETPPNTGELCNFTKQQILKGEMPESKYAFEQ